VSKLRSIYIARLRETTTSLMSDGREMHFQMCKLI